MKSFAWPLGGLKVNGVLLFSLHLLSLGDVCQDTESVMRVTVQLLKLYCNLIVTLQNWIAMSIRSTFLYYTSTYLFAVFETAVILRCTLASPLFIVLTLCNHQQPLVLLISNQKLLTILHISINCL